MINRVHTSDLDCISHGSIGNDKNLSQKQFPYADSSLALYPHRNGNRSSPRSLRIVVIVDVWFVYPYARTWRARRSAANLGFPLCRTLADNCCMCSVVSFSRELLLSFIRRKAARCHASLSFLVWCIDLNQTFALAPACDRQCL